MTEDRRGRVKVETGQKRVRVYLRGKLVADTLRPLLVWEIPYYPTYYVPLTDLRADLDPNGVTEHSPSRGEATGYDVTLEGLRVEGAALRYLDSPLPELKDAVRLDIAAFDWFEEDEQVFVHPRDPYSRVDILGSSRHVRVEIDGVTVADSHSPRILFETGLPARYYLPLTDVRMDLLTSSETHTSCPYKGTADYWNVRIGDTEHADIVWIYRTPLPESQKVAGLACFYNEKVDIYLDGVRQDRPHTPFG
ncbi:DUF427 domain-containing protein [Nocardia fluminea]|uniref:Uncharacterized protein (DUF427 family) n=1 Tax=Nocardia fluminea TaxID=134984 RepID=A0A2N3V966_9NOCA|nr:DUF427 domain-containing protein [Nocardia fluminea]PKV78172.1 uncharacterized protein (DUF427 family) [Nocardia fluminea]